MYLSNKWRSWLRETALVRKGEMIMGMEERLEHYGAAGVTPNTGEYRYGTDVPHVDANLDNIKSAQEAWQPSSRMEASQWLDAIANLGDTATASDKMVAKYLEEGLAYVDSSDLSSIEADEYLDAVLSSAETYSEEEDAKQKVGEKAVEKSVEKTLSSVA